MYVHNARRAAASKAVAFGRGAPHLAIMTRIVAIAGGSASCKTTLARAVAARLAGQRVVIIGEDDYYRSRETIPDFDPLTHNFDAPMAKDDALLCAHLAAARRGEPFDKPVYDLRTHTRLAQTERVDAADFVVVEGLHVLATPELCAQMDVKVYMECEESLRLGRRMIRDVVERARTPQSVLQQFFTNVRPMHARYVEPQRAHADLLLTATFEGGPAETETHVAAVLARLAAL